MILFFRYYCYICKMVDGVGVCIVCVKVCYKDYDLIYVKFGFFFCDCGVKDDGSCKVLENFKVINRVFNVLFCR